MSGDGLNDPEIQELARVFRDPSSAEQLLDIAGFPHGRRPNWQGLDSEGFWRQVNVLLGSGVMAEGRRRILEAAHKKFPANPVFADDSTALAIGDLIDHAALDARSMPEPGLGPGPGPGSRKRRGGFLAHRRARLGVAVGTVVAILAATVTAVILTRGDGVEIRMEPVGRSVVDGYMPSIGQDTDIAPVAPPSGDGDPGGGVVPADTAGLFGGTRDDATCDRAQLIAFLRGHPDLLAAWTSVLHVNPADLDTYVNSLTPVVLRSDTLVTNHGFADGRTTERQAVLQAGTAVLVDGHGKPVVKCGCGNPLTEPMLEPTSLTSAELTGDRWDGFSGEAVVQVQPSPTEAQSFVVADLDTRDNAFSRIRGTAGTDDRDFVPVEDVDWRNTAYPQVDCAGGRVFDVENGVGEITHEGTTYTLTVLQVAVGDLAGASSGEVAVLLSCETGGTDHGSRLLYTYRDGPNILDTPRPPAFEGQTAAEFTDNRLEIEDRLLVAGANYTRADGSGDTERRILKYMWDGRRLVNTAEAQDTCTLGDYVTGVRPAGRDSPAAVREGVLPAGTPDGPAVTVAPTTTVVNGGSLQVPIRATGAFVKLLVGIQDVDGTVRTPAECHYETVTAAPVDSENVVLVIAQNLPRTSFVLNFAVVDEQGRQGVPAQQVAEAIEVGTGDVQVSLSWDTASDVDLHVVDPNGNEIFFANRRVSSGGILDLDSNAGCEIDRKNNENITWANAPEGVYSVGVDYYSSCGVPKTNYVVIVHVVGQEAQIFNGQLTGPGRLGGVESSALITRFTVGP